MTQARYPDGQTQTKSGASGAMVCVQVGHERVTVERWGDWVVYTEGLGANDSIRELREVLWSTRRVGTYPR